MAAEDVQDTTATDAGPPLPPEQPLPAAAADAAQVGPALSDEQVLQQAAYGDNGAANYQALRAAGQQAPSPTPTPTAPPGATGIPPGMLPGDPNASGLQYILGGGGAAAPSPLMDLFHPGSAGKMQQGVLSREQAVQKFQQEQQSMAIQGLDFLEKMRANNTPPEIRIAMIQNLAAQQGKPLTQAQAAYIDLLHKTDDGVHLLRRIKLGADPNATPAQKADSLQATADYTSLFSADPTKQVNAIADIRKASADADKAVDEAIMTHAKVPYAGPEAAAGLREKQLTNDLKQKDVDTFYNDLEKQVVAEATKRGMQPGTPDFTNYIAKRKAQLDTYAKRQALMNQPLSGRLAEDFNQADRAGKFATEALALLSDPTVAANRGVVEGRLKNMAWRLGFAQSPNEDLYQSLSNISGLMGSKVYSGGIRNMKWIDRVLEHTIRPGDQIDLVKDKVNVLLRAAREQQQGIINTQTTPIGKLQPTVQETAAPGTPAPAAAAGGEVSAQDFLNR